MSTSALLRSGPLVAHEADQRPYRRALRRFSYLTYLSNLPSAARRPTEMLPAAAPLGIGSGIQWPLLGMAITINRYPARCQFQVVQDIPHARRHKPCPAHHRIPFLQLSVLANERLLLLASRPIRVRYDKLHAQSISLPRSCPDLPPLAISALFLFLLPCLALVLFCTTRGLDLLRGLSCLWSLVPPRRRPRC